MRIVELPEEESGWADITVDDKYVGTFWISDNNVDIDLGLLSWRIGIRDKYSFSVFIHADAIRRK